MVAGFIVPGLVVASVLRIRDLDGVSRVDHVIAQKLSDAALAEFHRQLRHKIVPVGWKAGRVGRFFPSSKRFPACGQLLDGLPLGVRRWSSPGCGTEHDRDVNAAVNLRNWAVTLTVTAYCPGRADRSENSGATLG
jgi:putative transposase